jgi:DNA-binding MurR/RpiR family transcriptional regulator
MYIIDHIEAKYDRSIAGSASDRLSEYFLINLDEISETSLSEIAVRANVSKGYITKYVSNLTEEGTYASFQNALAQEMGYTKRTLHNLLTDANDLLHYEEIWIPVEKIRYIVGRIKQADKIWVIGNLSIQSGIIHLLRMLWANNIPARYINGFSFNEDPKLSTYIGYNDIVFLISPSTTIDEYVLKTAPTFDILSNLKNKKVIFFGEGKSAFDNVEIIPIKLGKRLFSEVDFSVWLSASIISEFKK